MLPAMMVRVGVMGGGAWGTALANVLAGKGHAVTLWAREPQVVQDINQWHQNKTFLPEVPLHQGLSASSSLAEVCRDKDLLLSVVPAQFVRAVMQEAAPFIAPSVPIVSASKGIETTSLKLIKDVLEEIIPGITEQQLCFLSGPTFAREVALGKPAAATIAGRNAEATRMAQELISTPFFKLYQSSDIVGVEVGGAVKNVIAIAAGIVDGLGLGHSARAGVMTRGLNEMMRLGVELGAQALTFLGLCGLGDLILTCTGDLSRNRTMGLELAKGRTREEILGSRQAVTEGVATAEAIHRLAGKLSLELPICEEIYQILFHHKSPSAAVAALASRELKTEL